MDQVLTLIAGANPLDPTRILEIEVTLRGAGADVGPADWLAPLAGDLPFAGIPPLPAPPPASAVLAAAAVSSAPPPQAGRRQRGPAPTRDSPRHPNRTDWQTSRFG